MGRPLPGFRVALLDANGEEQKEGEICLALEPRPTGLMQGYQAEDGGIRPMEERLSHGRLASIDDDGYLTYVGRADDVFKSSDYRISPFELESVLIEHPAVAEAAVVPSPDPMRLSVPRRLALAPGHAATATRRFRFFSIAARRWRRSSGCVGSNSRNCRRRSPVRSAGSNCGGPKPITSGAANARLLEFWEDDFSESEIGKRSERT